MFYDHSYEYVVTPNADSFYFICSALCDKLSYEPDITGSCKTHKIGPHWDEKPKRAFWTNYITRPVIVRFRVRLKILDPIRLVLGAKSQSERRFRALK